MELRDDLFSLMGKGMIMGTHPIQSGLSTEELHAGRLLRI